MYEYECVYVCGICMGVWIGWVSVNADVRLWICVGVGVCGCMWGGVCEYMYALVECVVDVVVCV